MDVRFNQEADGVGLKRGAGDRDSSQSFLKEQRDSDSPSGTMENCEKHRGSAGDPDYCRRILVRGESPGRSAASRDGADKHAHQREKTMWRFWKEE